MATKSRATKKQQQSFFTRERADWLLRIAFVVFPLLSVPQVVQLYQAQEEGISIWSWLGFAGITVLFLIYSWMIRNVPLVVINLVWAFVYLIVILGAMLYS